MKNVSKKWKIIYFVIFVILLAGFIWIGKKDFKANDVSDNLKFSQEYKEVTKKNVFKYANSTDVYTAIKTDRVIIFFGFPQNQFSGTYAKIVNKVAQSKSIPTILYYNFYHDRKNKSATYESIVNYLKDYLHQNDLGKINLSAPSLLVVKDGKIIYYDEEVSYLPANLDAKTYWNKYNIGLKETTLETVMTEYVEVTNGK